MVDLQNDDDSTTVIPCDGNSTKLHKKKRKPRARKQPKLNDCGSKPKKQALEPKNSDVKPKAKTTCTEPTCDDQSFKLKPSNMHKRKIKHPAKSIKQERKDKHVKHPAKPCKPELKDEQPSKPIKQESKDKHMEHPAKPCKPEMKDEHIAKLGHKEVPDFGTMRVKELKEYIQKRGVPVSTYKKKDLIQLAHSLHDMDAIVDPDFTEDSIEQALKDRLTLPAGGNVPDPFKIKNFSNDFSSLPNFGLMDIFNHLIMSNAEYDKDKLASWRSFDEYALCQNGHVQSMQNMVIFDKDDKKYHLVTAQVIPTQKDSTPEGDKMYKLWYILKPNGAIYSAFCKCKGGADQGCRHLGAALFELYDFLSRERPSVTSLPAYWHPKPKPDTRPVPYMEMKMSHTPGLRSKRVMTNHDESWIDSFDPRPTRQRNDPPDEVQKEFAKQLKDIDKHSGILDFLDFKQSNLEVNNLKSSSSDSDSECSFETDIYPFTITARLEAFAIDHDINEENVDNMTQLFVDNMKVTQEEIDTVSTATIGQHTNSNWHDMRHLLVTAKKVKGLYTRQKTVEKNPDEDVTKTVHNFLSPAKMEKYPPAIQHGIENEPDAKKYYITTMTKKHRNLEFEEPGLVLSGKYGWLGASPDGIRKCDCCPDTLVEIKCPYKGFDMHPKEAFLLDTIGGCVDKNGTCYLRRNHLHYFQIQTGMAVCGVTQCDFIVFTNKGIHVVQVDFDKDFWESTINTVKAFYTRRIIKTLLLEL